MVNVAIAETNVTDAVSDIKNYFVDGASPVSFVMKNTGSKAIRLAVYGGYNTTKADMIKEIETEGDAVAHPDNPDIAAGETVNMKIENPYDYVLITAVCPTALETSKVKGTIIYEGHL